MSGFGKHPTKYKPFHVVYSVALSLLANYFAKSVPNFRGRLVIVLDDYDTIFGRYHNIVKVASQSSQDIASQTLPTLAI